MTELNFRFVSIFVTAMLALFVFAIASTGIVADRVDCVCVCVCLCYRFHGHCS